MTRREAVLALASLVAIPLMGCRAGDPSIVFDSDSCEFCRMTISDRRFGAAARTGGGRIVRFDSIECLASWVDAATEPPLAIWLVDAMAPGTLVALDAAEIRRADVSTPMSGEARSEERGARSGGLIAMARSHGSTPWKGEVVTWSAVLAGARK